MLIQYVLLALPTHAISVVHLSVSILNQMEKKFRAFLWGHSMDTREFHHIAWDKICLPKANEDLDFTSLIYHKRQCIRRLAAFLILHSDSLWARLIEAKYHFLALG